MDLLPSKIRKMIFDKILWENPEELFRLRAVSRKWKSAAEQSGSEVFKYWYNRCKTEIPEDHLADIVQAKYPLVAYPWKEFYWVDRGLAHVAKKAYEIWKSFPNFDGEIDAKKLDCDWPLGDDDLNVARMNDKYFGKTVRRDNEKSYSWVTEIYQWNNKNYFRKYDLKSYEIDFYTTEKGTFVLLRSWSDDKKENYISKHPIDNLDIPSELILLRNNDEYYITQNEYFSIKYEYNRSKTVTHKILTERGFQTSTTVQLPEEMRHAYRGQFRIEISGCTLYFMWKIYAQLSIAKCKISRNSDGKLTIILENWEIVDEDGSENPLYSQIYNLFDYNICSTNFNLTGHMFASEKFNSWLKDAFNGDVRAIAVHSNYVICEEQKRRGTQICIFQKDNLVECMESNDADHLKPVFRDNFPLHTEFSWIGIIYNDLKLQILAHYYKEKFCRINFY